MDLPWGDELASAFVTNVGLITSDGPHGPNIMAAEWTHQLSYSPGLIGIGLGHRKATAENIRATGFFGVSIAAADQNWVASLAGGSSGRDVDKVAALRELGARFRQGENVLLVEGAAFQAECRVLQAIPTGDHTLFVGEVIAAHRGAAPPLTYHRNTYHLVGERIPKPPPDMLEKIRATVERHAKH